jgi:hypothetical protein
VQTPVGVRRGGACGQPVKIPPTSHRTTLVESTVCPSRLATRVEDADAAPLPGERPGSEGASLPAAAKGTCRTREAQGTDSSNLEGDKKLLRGRRRCRGKTKNV